MKCVLCVSIYLERPFDDAQIQPRQFGRVETIRLGTRAIRILVQKCDRFLCWIVIIAFRFDHARHVSQRDALIIVEIID